MEDDSNVKRADIDAVHIRAHMDDGSESPRQKETSQENMDAVRQQVKELFRKCRETLDKREQALLRQITEERKSVQPQLLSRKKKVTRNHSRQLNLTPLGSIEEGSGSDDNKSCNKDEDDIKGCRDCNPGDSAKDTLWRKRGRKLKARHSEDNGYYHSDGLARFHLSKADKKEIKQFENAVQNLGLIYTGNADPSKTIAVARPALVFAKCTAKVKAIDVGGVECKEGGDAFTATMGTPEGGTLPCDITDNDNGTYTIGFKPKFAGTHELHIRVSGQPIRSSPLQVRVQPVRLQAKSSFVGGPCMFGLDIPNKYKLPPGDMQNGTDTEPTNLIPNMMNITVRNQKGKIMESSVIGCVCNDKEISTYNIRFLPMSPGDYDIQVCLKNSGMLLAQQVIPVHEREQIGRKGHGVGEFMNPTDVAVSPEGNVFVADTVENSRIQRFTSDGRHVASFQVAFQEPSLIGVDSVHIAAAFLNSKQVALYTHEGHLVHQFTHDQLTHPHGIALNSRGNIYIIDLSLQCLLIFTKTGKLLTRLGQEGSRPGEFNHPHFLSIGFDDHIFISEGRNCRIQELGQVGTYVKELRSKDKIAQPGSIAVTSGGHLLVLDEASQKIQIINLDDNRFAGSLQLQLMQPNTARIGVTHDGYIIILDMFEHCLWRYRIPYSS